MEPISIHSLPPEIINIIVEFIGIREGLENRRCLRSEHKLCQCQDEEQERYFAMKDTQHDFRFHSDALSLSCSSRQLRAIIFDARRIQGISVPFYRSALDKVLAMPEKRKEDVL